ncbi:hypothetical protein B5807_08910 [Epicoccum nigrum]|uniref:Uncharacterized protein n=1 Tax=Epicoccum nigrum TaxID=105696 RepID=A0A1Y2LSC0_EPING|nr:hypothetical protein B5807_08910 [Epicoccum nigrum]
MVPRATPATKTLLSPSPTPLATLTSSTASPPSTLLATPTHHPSSPSKSPRPNTIVLDHTPPPTMQPAAPHNIFALPSTSPAQLLPHTLLAILLLVIVLTIAATWTLLVCLVHHRGTTTRGKSTHAAYTRAHTPSPPPSTHGCAWLRNPFKQARGPQHKYEALDHRDADAEDERDGNRALSSALELRSVKGTGGEDGSPLNPFLVGSGRDSDDEGRGGMRGAEEE